MQRRVSWQGGALSRPNSIRPYRILFLCTSIEIGNGGIASVNRGIIRALNSDLLPGLPLDVSCIAFNDQKVSLPVEYLASRETIQFRVSHNSKPRFVFDYLKTMKSFKPDLVLVDHVALSTIPYLFRNLFPVPYVVCCHGREINVGATHLRAKALSAAYGRITNSEFTRETLLKSFPMASAKVCHLGIDDLALPETEETVRNLPDANGQNQALGDKVVLFVGRLHPAERYKGLDEIIRAFPKVLLGQSNAQLVIAGSGFELTSKRGSTSTLTRWRTLADSVRPGMRMLMIGLNPSLHSADSGIGYFRAGNRFWPAMLAAGLVTRDRDPQKPLTRR